MRNSGYVRWFKDIGLNDVPLVGGKNASLGELYSALSPQGVRVPNGFTLTAQYVKDNGIRAVLKELETKIPITISAIANLESCSFMRIIAF